MCACDESVVSASDKLGVDPKEVSQRTFRDAVFHRHWKGDRRMLIFAVLLMGLVNMAYSIEACQYPGDGNICYATLAIRSGVFLWSLLFALALRWIKTIPAQQVALFGWQLVMSTALVLCDSLIPSDGAQHSLGDLGYLIAIFLFMPNRLLFQTISGIYFTVIHIFMIFNHGGFSHLWWESVLIFPVAILCGAYISWRILGDRIQEYERWQGEHQARVQLESAMDKIKRLSGLLPICAYCKKVRDDTGYWHEVETFIRSHSTADFSHSLCPDCGEEHYPGILTKDDFAGEN